MQPFKKILMSLLCGAFIAFSLPIKAEYDSYDISTILNWNLKTVLSADEASKLSQRFAQLGGDSTKLDERIAQAAAQ
jgi:hypothetical protein